ncbi:IucA/IucC family protein [Vibrio zhugei]|uniref:IucA/IucC family protein n=1 Tax=Vibrio zhugei TaxID=2479546 RepID=A0ABV7CB94_9VIBR|nr:IucA/IucC family protein [Vibrio zhugei]
MPSRQDPLYGHIEPEHLSLRNSPALACFLNSLARESSAVQFIEQHDRLMYQLPLSQERVIHIPVHYYSQLGNHHYQLPALLQDEHGVQSLSSHALIELILNEPALVGVVTTEQKSLFMARVLESQHNTQQAIQYSPYQEALFNDALNFQTAEQGLLIGHSFHPAPKSREQFSLEDAKRYSPEFGGHFALHWLLVDSDRILSGSSAGKSFSARIAELVAHDAKLTTIHQQAELDNKTLLPVHPWQWAIIAKLPAVERYVQSGQITHLSEQGATWYPTSSTRSLYAPTLPYMLKFSLSVKLTNSIRHLSLKEVIRGTRLNDLFQQTSLSDQLGQGQGFQLMQEPAFMGLLDEDGAVIDATLVAFRDNLLADVPEQEAVVLATLTQQNPYGGASLVAERVRAFAKHTTPSKDEHQAAITWFSEYCRHTVVPLFNLQANFGIVFLAHQQNIVLQMKNGCPVGMYFRDCQGTGYTDLAFQCFGESLGADKDALENYWNQDKVRRYFAYYLIINSTFNVISSMAAHLNIEEATLVSVLRQHLQTLLASGVKDDRCLRYVLDNDVLCCKGNFFCYLQNFNENSIPDPAVIYFDLPNPMAHQPELAHV